VVLRDVTSRSRISTVRVGDRTPRCWIVGRREIGRRGCSDIGGIDHLYRSRSDRRGFEADGAGEIGVVAQNYPMFEPIGR